MLLFKSSAEVEKHLASRGVKQSVSLRSDRSAEKLVGLRLFTVMLEPNPIGMFRSVRTEEEAKALLGSRATSIGFRRSAGASSAAA